jgi:serine/threonine protein phosphatase PrpC
MATISDSVTHVGTIRTTNEDAILDYTDAGLWAVADGMGGHQAGDYASECIIKHLSSAADNYRGKELVEQMTGILGNAHKAIYQHSQHLSGSPIIGSTIVVLIMEADNYHCFWSGDSRCYLLRHNELTLITADHTEAQEMRTSGDSTEFMSETEKVIAENTLIHAIGIDEASPHVDYVKGHIYEYDRFMLCSDGVNKVYTDEEINIYLSHSTATTANENLLNNALLTDAPDNISSIIISLE